MSRLRKLIHEVHRRSLWQVLAIYCVTWWVVFEVIQTLTEGLGLPDWFPAFAFVLLLIGLPIVLATAFVQEGAPGADARLGAPSEKRLIDGEPRPLDVATWTPEGDESGGVEEGSFGSLFTWRNAIAGGVIAFAVWGVLAAGWIFLGGGSGSLREAATDAGVARASVAVLPFENLSGDEGMRPFTEGVHDDLLTQLAKIRSLKVISRTSVMEYRGSAKGIREIADELGVAAVLEGGVQRSGERIRVNAQLIAGREDEHLWAETFNRRLTAENVFEIQTELARRIAEALRAELTPEEEARLAERPTDDLEAYDFYVRGNDYAGRSYDEEDQELAIRMFEQAVEEDTTFTEAWAALSNAHSYMYLLGHDRTDERLERSKQAVDRALAMESENPHARMALGTYYYRGFQDYDRALAEYERAVEDLPGDAQVLGAIAAAHRRAGNWERALERFAETVELDPRSAAAHYELGATYYLMRRYAEAIPPLERAIALSPDWSNPYSFLAIAESVESGRLEDGWSVLASYPGGEGLEGSRVWQLIYQGDYDAALEASGALDEIVETQYGIFPRDLITGMLHHVMGRQARGRADLESAAAILEERLERAPDDPRVHAILGEVCAWLGEEEPAGHHGRRAVELYPVDRDALEGPSFLTMLARIHAILGNEKEALDLLERLLAMPGRLEPVQLHHDPAWESVRDRPRFEALLEPWG